MKKLLFFLLSVVLMPPEIADMMLGEMPPEQQMYVISNNKGINGAVSMLYEDGLHELAEKLGSDLYIMPSSIHEVIAVSTDLGNPNSFQCCNNNAYA